MTSLWAGIAGGKEMLAWFGGTDRFHDALLQEFVLRADGTGSLQISTCIMKDETDEKGFFVPDRHACVTLDLFGIRSVNVMDVDMVPGIIFSLDIRRTDAGYTIEWSESYGINGSIVAKDLAFSLVPENR